MRVAIIGGGVAGLACAQRLAHGGMVATVFDKGRGPGGRMATRRMSTPRGDVSFDHGCPAFEARHPAFRREVEAWTAAGAAAPSPAAEEGAHVGVPGMSAVAKAMAADLDVRLSTRVDAVARSSGLWTLACETPIPDGFDALVVAVPAEQAAPLLGAASPAFAGLAGRVRSVPCWTVMALFDRPLAVEANARRSPGAIGWASRETAKPGRTGPERWVIQAGAAWSSAHLEAEPQAIIPALIEAFGREMGATVPLPISAAAHRWRYARAPGLDLAPLWDGELQLGVCGDWLGRGDVESAWLSGFDLASRLLDPTHPEPPR